MYDMLITVVSFVLGLGILIAVHEYGHYRMAVACGVRVLRFSIGFGKPLFVWKRSDTGTEFVVAMVPLGGFVRMLDEREAPVLASHRHMAFNTQTVDRRALIVLAGPLANLLLAVVLYAGVSWWGLEQAKPMLGTPLVGSLAAQAGLRAGDWVSATQIADDAPVATESFEQLRWSLTSAALNNSDIVLWVSEHEADGAPRELRLPLSDLDVDELDARLFERIGLMAPFSAARLGQIMPSGAAAFAGLKEGGRIHKVGSREIADAQELRALIRASVGGNGNAQTLNWTVEREGRMLVLPVTPKPERSDSGWTARIGAYVGAQPSMTVVSTDWFDSVVHGLAKTGEMSLLTVKMMAKMVMGEASLKNRSGPISIADHAGKSAHSGFISYVLFLAVISVSLGVLNLLPVPVLDGGHLMYYLYEAVTGREPSPAWTDRLQRGGMTFLMGMMAIALFNDVARLLG